MLCTKKQPSASYSFEYKKSCSLKLWLVNFHIIKVLCIYKQCKSFLGTGERMSVNTDGHIHLFYLMDWGCRKAVSSARMWAGLDLLLWWLPSRASKNKYSNFHWIRKLLLSSNLYLHWQGACRVCFVHSECKQYGTVSMRKDTHTQFLVCV